MPWTGSLVQGSYLLYIMAKPKFLKENEKLEEFTVRTTRMPMGSCAIDIPVRVENLTGSEDDRIMTEQGSAVCDAIRIKYIALRYHYKIWYDAQRDQWMGNIGTLDPDHVYTFNPIDRLNAVQMWDKLHQSACEKIQLLVNNKQPLPKP